MNSTTNELMKTTRISPNLSRFISKGTNSDKHFTPVFNQHEDDKFAYSFFEGISMETSEIIKYIHCQDHFSRLPLFIQQHSIYHISPDRYCYVIEYSYNKLLEIAILAKKHETQIKSLKEQDTLLGYEDDDEIFYKGENSEIQQAFGSENLKHTVDKKKKKLNGLTL